MAATRKAKKDVTEGVGARLKYAIAVSGWSRRALSKVTGVRADAIGRLERGERLPELPALRALATALGIPSGWFVFGEGGVPEIPVAAPENRDQRKALLPPRDGLRLLASSIIADSDSGPT